MQVSHFPLILSLMKNRFVNQAMTCPPPDFAPACSADVPPAGLPGTPLGAAGSRAHVTWDDRNTLCTLVVLLLLLAPTLHTPGAVARKAAAPLALFNPDFSQFEKQFPWQVPQELVDKLSARQRGINYDEAKVKCSPLPDSLTLANGTAVTTTSVWEQQRRNELLALFRSEIYGVAPPKPDNLAFRVLETNPKALDGKATLKRVAISFKLQDEEFVFHLNLFVPNQRQARAPAFVLLSHRTAQNEDITALAKTEFWPADYAVSRGYAMALVPAAEEVEPDKPDADFGVRLFYKKHFPNPEQLTWATISAWAWSALRAMDYLETDPDINKSQVAVVGHSRGGKTALWAGAQDTRFALVCPNDSGCTGTSLSKRNLGEDVAAINSRFPHWFTAKYKTYNGKEELLPVDQHEAVALVAPRGLHDGEGTEDLWADPRGAWLSLVEASKVWALYGAATAMKDPMPKVNELAVNGPIAFHLRDGGHALGSFDWKLYLDHADRLFNKGTK